ncbi:MAG TPA: MFS transporter [Solirubrobacteraceae bacterium]|jgi:EmrB/QacA subfamily drug resistance transporter|nr:MFS transporter [Solirubrobacteraceae bacterium]
MNNRPLILVSLLLAAFAINLDTTIVNVALPTLVRELHATNSQLQWIVDAYNLVFAALLLAAGSLSDRLGRKGMLLAGLGLFGLSSALGGFAANSGQLIAARCLMGLGAAMVFPSTLSLISNVFTERGERARAIGLWGATAGIAIALGPIVGGWLLGRFSWASIFFALAPVAAIAAALVARYVPSSRDPDVRPIDRPGFALSTASIGLIVYTIIEAPDYGWSSARSIAGFALGLGLLAAFIATERRASDPMLDVRLFKNPRFAAACAAVTVSFFTLLGFIFVMTQYFQFIKRYDALSAGVHLLPVAVSVGVSSVLGTKLALRFGTKLVVASGLLMVTAFYVWVAAIVAPGNAYSTIAIQMVLYGTGMGLTSAPATEAIMGVVPRGKAGVGSAVNDTTRLLGGTLGVAVIGSVYASIYGSRLSSSLPGGLPHAAGALAHSSVGAALGLAKQLTGAGHAALGGAVEQAASGAFIKGLSAGCVVAAVAAAGGAVVAAALLPAQPIELGDDALAAGAIGFGERANPVSSRDDELSEKTIEGASR